MVLPKRKRIVLIQPSAGLDKSSRSRLVSDERLGCSIADRAKHAAFNTSIAEGPAYWFCGLPRNL